MPIAIGLALLAAAWRMDAIWFDRHILPSFFVARQTQWHGAVALRVALGSLGLLLFALTPVIVRLAQQKGMARIGMTAALTGAAVLGALGATEAILHLHEWRRFQARNMHREPQRLDDARLGWKHVASHAGRDSIGGRTVDYAFDSHGYRVAAPGAETDLAAPSILFVGESVMLGFGLEWRETIAARTARDLRLQPVNLAATGYSTDQSFLRLETELPRFRCPAAVVSLFMPAFLDRNINRDRPHLDAHLAWHPPSIGWRLPALARYALAYRSAPAVNDGVAVTAAVLRASARLAQARGARLLVVVPAFMPESSAERSIRRRVLDRQQIAYLFVPLDAAWRIPGDDHPDARAASAIGEAITRALSGTATEKDGRCGS